MVAVVGSGGEILVCADPIWVYGRGRCSGRALDVPPLIESRERNWDGIEESLALRASVSRVHHLSIGARSVLRPGAVATTWVRSNEMRASVSR